MNTEITSENDIETDITDIKYELDGVASEVLDLSSRCLEIDNSLGNLWNNQGELAAKVGYVQQDLETLTFYVKEIFGIILDSNIDKATKETASRLAIELDEEEM